MGSRWESEAFESLEIGASILADLKGGQLKYQYHPLFDWRPQANIALSTIETNEYALRSESLSKTQDNKCLLIGGSFAWGYGASCNAMTPAGILQSSLDTRILDTSVISLAEQMYASTQQIKSFIFSVNELKPSSVICVTGYNDTSQGFKNIYRNHPKCEEMSAFSNWGMQTGTISSDSNLKKILKIAYHLSAKFNDPYGDDLSFIKPEQSEIPENMCLHTVNVINSYCQANNIKSVFVLEPLVYFKTRLTESEKSILDYVGEEKRKYFINSFQAIKNAIQNLGDATFIDSSDFIVDITETLFFDDIHMSDKGYSIWTEKLFDKLNAMNFFE